MDPRAAEIHGDKLRISISVQQAPALCSLRVLVVARPTRVLAPPTLELVRRSPPKQLAPALCSVRTTLPLRSIAVAYVRTFCPGAAAL